MPKKRQHFIITQQGIGVSNAEKEQLELELIQLNLDVLRERGYLNPSSFAHICSMDSGA